MQLLIILFYKILCIGTILYIIHGLLSTKAVLAVIVYQSPMVYSMFKFNDFYL